MHDMQHLHSVQMLPNDDREQQVNHRKAWEIRIIVGSLSNQTYKGRAVYWSLPSSDEDVRQTDDHTDEESVGLQLQYFEKIPVLHNHQERTPNWGMAVQMSPLQAVLSCARRQAEKRPMLAGFRPASTARVHVCAGLPLRLFQSHGWP